MMMMAEGDATAYNHFKEILLLGDCDLVADVIKIFLLGAGYALDIDGSRGYADVSAQEITTTTGYVAGGDTLAGKSVAQNDTLDNAKWDANDVTWTSLAATVIDHAIIYDDTVTAPVADPLLVHFEIATDANGGDYKLAFNALGILTLS